MLRVPGEEPQIERVLVEYHPGGELIAQQADERRTVYLVVDGKERRAVASDDKS